MSPRRASSADVSSRSGNPRKFRLVQEIIRQAEASDPLPAAEDALPPD
jgi:hypothetical protein